MKKLTEEMIIKKLKKAAIKKNEENAVRYKKNKKYGSLPKKEVFYRNVAGPFKVKACEFRNQKNSYFFNPINMEARSYGWWGMITVINGKIIHNACNYSQSTSGHQDKLALAIKALGIKVDVTVNTRANILNMHSVVADYLSRHAELLVKFENAQTKTKPFYKDRIKDLERLMLKMESAKIGARFTKKAKAEALKTARIERTKKIACLRERKVRRDGFLTVKSTDIFKAPVLTLLKIQA